MWAAVDSFRGNSSSLELVAYRPCPICSSSRSRAALALDDFQFYSDSTTVPKRVDVRQVQCLDCFALYLNPCYSAFGFRCLFAEAGQSYGSTEGRPAEQLEWMRARGLLRSGSRVFDVGCYDGRFLSRLPDDVVKAGVDVDAPAIERGRARFAALGIDFVHGDLETFRYDGSPDAITMFHVLEHLPRPVSVLRNLRSIAHPSTRLVVEVPVLEKGATNDINGFFSVQHMTHFSRTSLRNALDQAGWKPVEEGQQSDYNGFRVLAEPSGAAGAPSRPVESRRAVAGDSADVAALHACLSAWHTALAEANGKLSAAELGERCVVWGGGAHSEFLYHTTALFHTDRGREYVIVDSDASKHGKTWRGIEITGPAILTEIDWSDTRLVISSYGSQEKIAAAAIAAGVPAQSIVRIYDTLRIY